uniref:ATRX ADD domain-containing protein n=1 Tax=Lygus hesperus TaxID=30085 RepID=A0A0K8SXB6_LYGHE
MSSIKMGDSKGDETPNIPDRLRKILQPTEEEKEFRLKLYPDVAVVEDAKILCTICQKDVKHVFLLKNKSYKHVFLRVAVCKGCMKFYDDGDFSVDEDGDDKYCRWCGQGGTLLPV